MRWRRQRLAGEAQMWAWSWVGNFQCRICEQARADFCRFAWRALVFSSRIARYDSLESTFCATTTQEKWEFSSRAGLRRLLYLSMHIYISSTSTFYVSKLFVSCWIVFDNHISWELWFKDYCLSLFSVILLRLRLYKCVTSLGDVVVYFVDVLMRI